VAERATIARPYAKAAFEAALPARAFARWSAGLTAAAQIVIDPRVAELIKNPELPAPTVADFIIGVAGEQLDAQMQNFVRVLAECPRSSLITK
jgi:F-type H+-transporting ATPase subunit delta